ncbi:peptidoglycan-binding domain-containing protein [Streptomyces mesophilus]|uniref:peptidoglycan-binding domain-containing protein n=1 Tax=Streptomyces mesophilus TaxID=1775132 RepID=UPI00331CAB86
MNFRSTRGRLAAAAIGALAACTMAVSATPASAAASDGYLSGGGSIFDDFGDEGTLSTSSYASSGVTCFWQNVLYAEGAIESDGSTFDREDIDGHFGANTKAATQSLQRRWSLTADGIVGNGTFGKADRKRTYLPDVDGGVWTTGLEHLDTYSNGHITAKYHGVKHTFRMNRGYQGRWDFVNARNYGNWNLASYNTLHCA